MHLEQAQCKALGEGITASDELRALLDREVAGSLICLSDNDREVLGPEEWWNGRLDSVKPVLEPLCSLHQARQRINHI